MAVLITAFVTLHVTAPGAAVVEAHALGSSADASQTQLCDGSERSEELSGHYWNRDRQQAEDLVAAKAAHDTSMASAAPAADASVPHASPRDELRALGDRSPDTLQVFRC
ncbi:hypothetical protein LO772_32600 [Yinghuangia sp. ASG 101]|uniref:hypothetical protein n=1 Tax=Yinghuangia sp. ASG 101 TaxID=2896848 RepID=UPI001E504B5F|nr:hypothetical protein [Yinghuangia sp. ASG 101]UGQ11474.1 hypothetical protein LO772_32600 [Yinghuangia sp. ASG 101]